MYFPHFNSNFVTLLTAEKNFSRVGGIANRTRINLIRSKFLPESSLRFNQTNTHYYAQFLLRQPNSNDRKSGV